MYLMKWTSEAACRDGVYTLGVSPCLNYHDKISTSVLSVESVVLEVRVDVSLSTSPDSLQLHVHRPPPVLISASKRRPSPALHIHQAL